MLFILKIIILIENNKIFFMNMDMNMDNIYYYGYEYGVVFFKTMYVYEYGVVFFK